MNLNKEDFIVMAVSCIAEEEKTDISRIKVISLRETSQNSLIEYADKFNYQYKKYQLGDEMV